jgi:monoamine oxidase
LKAGRDVVVLEARDRVGGRLWTGDVDGAMLEIGGQWVSPDQDALIETLDELGLETYPRHREGVNVYIVPDGALKKFEGDIFPVPPATEHEIVSLIDRLDALVAEIDPEQPWAHPRARELDEISFARWLETQTDDEEARGRHLELRILELSLRVVVEPDRVAGHPDDREADAEHDPLPAVTHVLALARPHAADHAREPLRLRAPAKRVGHGDAIIRRGC